MARRPKTTVKISDISPLNVRVPHAALIIGVSEATVWRLLGSGELPSVRVGRARLIPVAAIHRLYGEAKSA